MKMKGKVTLITGGGKGIGAAIGKRFAMNQAKVVLVDIDSESLNQTQEELKKVGGESHAMVADVTKGSVVEEVIDEVKAKYGTIDVLVNNAGIIRDGFISNISEKDWDCVLDVNLKGAFLFSKAVFPIMKEKRKGKIVNISSRAWLGNVGQSNYSASKGGLISLTRTLALEFARYQINVNAVAPGLIDTPLTRALPEKVIQKLIQLQPTQKMGTVEDIGAAVEFLSSNESDFITGQVLHVDGGKSCGLLSL